MTRFLLLDVLRTGAVTLMVIYHLLFDLSYFWERIGPVTGGHWTLFIAAVASLFLLVAGMSFRLVRGKPLLRHAKRAAFILAAAAGISGVTWLVNPDAYIRFGILHLIGTGLLLLPFFARTHDAVVAVTGIGIVLIAPVITSLSLEHPALLPFGITYPGFRSLDYYPLFPWLGIMLLGYVIAPHVLRLMPQTYDTHDRPGLLLFPGRHALAIYLLHQPILFAILTLLLGLPTTH